MRQTLCILASIVLLFGSTALAPQLADKSIATYDIQSDGGRFFTEWEPSAHFGTRIAYSSSAIFPPMILIQMDDGIPSDYTTAYPLALSRGIPLTSYIIPGRIGSVNHLSWEQVHTMRADGFGIECHTYNHTRISLLTETELRDNLEKVDKAFLEAGLPSPEHHSYPFGNYDVTSQEIVAEYRKTARTTQKSQDKILHWNQDVNWHQLRSEYIVIGTTVDKVKSYIDSAIEGGYTLILYTHDISDSPGDYGCHTNAFEEILDYVALKRDEGLIDPVTIDGLYRTLQGIRTIRPATEGGMTFHGETTGATYGKIVSRVGFVWGTTRNNNPEGSSPRDASYEQSWILEVSDYSEFNFSHVPLSYVAGNEYYYRAAAEIDGIWYYGEELTYTSPEAPPYISFETPSGGGELMANVAVRFQGAISGDATSWEWDFGDGHSSTERNPSHIYDVAGIYHVTLTAANAYGTHSIVQIIEVLSAGSSGTSCSPISYASMAILLIWGVVWVGLYLYAQQSTLTFIIGISFGLILALLAGYGTFFTLPMAMAFTGAGILIKQISNR